MVYSNSGASGSSGSCRRRSSSGGWKICRPCGERRRGGRQSGSRYWRQCTHRHPPPHLPCPCPCPCSCCLPSLLLGALSLSLPYPQIPPIFSSFTLSLCFLLPFNPTLLPALLSLCLHSPSLCPSLTFSLGHCPSWYSPDSSSSPVSSYSHLCHIAPWGSSTLVPPHPHPADSLPSPLLPPSSAASLSPCPLPHPTPQEYIRHRLEEEQRQLEILQQQLLQEQALLLVTGSLGVLGKMPS